jgi:hypothetical protein
MSTEYTVGFQEMREIYVESIAPQNLLEKKKIKLDPVGQEDEDINNDGVENDEADKFLKGRREKLTDIINKRRGMDEDTDFAPERLEYYDWRSNISEDIQAALDELDGDQIKEKPVNNYAKGKNGKSVVTINPTINIGEAAASLGGELLMESELEIDDVIEIAADYFYEQGLTPEGVEIVMEELGANFIIEWALNLAEETQLNEARTLVGKKKSPAAGKQRGISLKAAPGKTTKEAVKKYGTIRRMPSQAGVIRKSLINNRVNNSVEKVKSQSTPERQLALPPAKESRRERASQKLATAAKGTKGTEVRAAMPSTESTPSSSRNDNPKDIKNLLAGTILLGLGATGAAWKAHKQAMKTKKEGGNLGSQLRAGGAELGNAAKNFFLKKQVQEAIESLISEGYELEDITITQLYQKLDYLEEKSVSTQQQKLFGAALSVKRGETPRSKVSNEVLEIVDSMSETEIRKFAKTKHKGLPKVKEPMNESISYEDILRFMKK